MSLKLTELVKQHEQFKEDMIGCIIGMSGEEFQKLCVELSGKVADHVAVHFESTELIKRIHNLVSESEITSFQPQLLPDDLMDVMAAHVEEIHADKPLHVQCMMLYFAANETWQATYAYVTENLRQRMQTIMRNKVQGVSKPKIITKI